MKLKKNKIARFSRRDTSLLTDRLEMNIRSQLVIDRDLEIVWGLENYTRMFDQINVALIIQIDADLSMELKKNNLKRFSQEMGSWLEYHLDINCLIQLDMERQRVGDMLDMIEGEIPIMNDFLKLAVQNDIYAP